MAIILQDGNASEYGLEFAQTKAIHLNSASVGVVIPHVLLDKTSYYLAEGLLIEYISKDETDALRQSSAYIGFVSSFGDYPKLNMAGRKRIKIGVTANQIKVLNDAAMKSAAITDESKSKGLFNRRSTDVVVEHDKEQAETKKAFYPYIELGIKEKASDVHFMARKGEPSLVKMRIYGDLVTIDNMPYEAMIGLLSACYNTLQDDSSNSDSSMNPDISSYCTITIPELQCKLRWQTVATGRDREFDVVLRIAPQSSGSLMTLERIGFTPVQSSMLKLIAKKPSGIVVIAGVTGSGKTTTLQTMVDIAKGDGSIKLYTIEDPIERVMSGVTQIQIQRNSDDDPTVSKFAGAVKTLMRSDPDVIMIGEIRDQETAEVAIDATRTGHLVFSTTHTNSAFGIAGRFMSPAMRIEPETLAEYGIISALIYQKLVPLICQHCKIPFIGNESLMPEDVQRQLFTDEERYQISPEKVAFKGDGCEHCKKGVSGMTVCAEMVNPTDKILRAIQKKDLVQANNEWRKSRRADFNSLDSVGKTAIEVGIAKVALGLIDPLRLQSDFGAFELETIIPI